jgi:aminoglycoside phosphotransferase (APT) family kinase protein
MTLSSTQIAAYLRERHGEPVEDVELMPLSDAGKAAAREAGDQLKIYGYGHPILVRYQLAGSERRAVLRTMAANPFGHEQRCDRAAGLIDNFDSFNQLPHHVRALDVGAVTPEGRLISLETGEEFFLLTDYVPGQLYADDLQRLCATGSLTELDLARARRLAGYLAEIHAIRRDDPALYRRHLRDVFGGGEGIAGLTDSYPTESTFATPGWLEEIERACVTWRWRLKAHPERLAQVHGDFHPFNLLFEKDTEFWLIDRSRGPWGEPADDVSAMTINYLFFSLQQSGTLAGPFATLWEVFWDTYLAASGDTQLLRVVAPFYTWRALVLASPVWYQVAAPVRYALLHFAEHVLHERMFDPTRVASYLVA